MSYIAGNFWPTTYFQSHYIDIVTEDEVATQIFSLGGQTNQFTLAGRYTVSSYRGVVSTNTLTGQTTSFNLRGTNVIHQL